MQKNGQRPWAAGYRSSAILTAYANANKAWSASTLKPISTV